MRWLPVVLCLLLAACGKAGLLRVAPASLGERTLVQQVTVVVGGESRSFDSVVEIEGNTLRLIASAVGLRLLSLEYDGARLAVTDNRLPPELPPERILNDLLLAVADAETLRAALPPGWQVQEGSDRDGPWRRIQRGTERPTEIRYDTPDRWNSRIRLQHADAPYQLDIRSQQLP